MSDRDASLDEASNIAFKALKEKPPAKPVDLYFIDLKLPLSDLQNLGNLLLCQMKLNKL